VYINDIHASRFPFLRRNVNIELPSALYMLGDYEVVKVPGEMWTHDATIR